MEVDVKAPHSDDIDVFDDDFVGDDIALQLALLQQQQTEQQRQALQCMIQLQRQFLPVPSNVALPLPLGLPATFVPPQPSSTPLPLPPSSILSVPSATPAVPPSIPTQAPLPVVQPLPSPDEANNEEMRHWAIGANLHRFIAAATPALTLGSSHFTLADVWSYYDQPYGHEVPLSIDGRECYAFFVPYLSAIQLFAPPTPSPFGPQPSTRPLFEYFEFLTPDQRMPLLDKVKQLGESFPILVNGKTSEIDTSRSWYSISWSPILCDHYTNKALSGCFLTYHRFEAVGDCPVTHLVCEEAVREQEQHDDHHHDDCDMDLGMEEIDCFCPSAPTETYLNFVGCVAYKVRPETWFDRKAEVPTLSALSLQSNVHRLLAEARVGNHPDLLHMTRRGAR